MTEMNAVVRWLVNLRAGSRAGRILTAAGPHLDFPESPRILELGAGNGALSLLLLERYPRGQVSVTDSDPRQVESIRATFRQRLGALPTTVDVRPVDARTLPYGDQTFEAVFAIMMLHHVDGHHSGYRERPKALREIRRVLVLGGRLVYQDFSRAKDQRRTLAELGFTEVFKKPRWPGQELVVFRAPRHPESSAAAGWRA